MLKTLKFTILTFRHGAIGASLKVTKNLRYRYCKSQGQDQPREPLASEWRPTESGMRPLSNTLSENFLVRQRSCCSQDSKLTVRKEKYCHDATLLIEIWVLSNKVVCNGSSFAVQSGYLHSCIVLSIDVCGYGNAIISSNS